jgi:sugar phosphate isomerase/epimerase
MPPKISSSASPVLLHVWSLARDLLSRRLDILQVPAQAAQAGFQGVEWLDRLMPSYEPAFWDELSAAQKEAGVNTSAFSLSLDITAGPQVVAAQKDRAQAIISLCTRLGVRALRVAVGGGGRLSMARIMLGLAGGEKKSSEPQPLNVLGRGLYWLMLSLPPKHHRAGQRADAMVLQSAAWSFQPLARQAASLGMRLGVENHYGLTSHPEDLLALLDLVAETHDGTEEHEHFDAGWAARSPLAGGGVGVCLDTGNYPEGVEPARAARLLAPRAVHVHWKLRSNPPSDEERRVLALHAETLSAVGYQGGFSVEFEGKGDGLAGARAGLELLNELFAPK